MGLNLYAKIEPKLGFDKEIVKLYKIFIDNLKKLLPNGGRILDVGCGSGEFCKMLKDSGFEVVGLDLSSVMVERAKSSGIDAYAMSLGELDLKDFDAITAVFDVLNYINPKEMLPFLSEIAIRLKPKGYFLADINSLYGFGEVAPGVLAIHNESESIIVEADFNGETLKTNFTLFSKTDSGLFSKETDFITQYFYDSSVFKNLPNLKFSKKQGIRLFGDKTDKELLIFIGE